MKKIILSCALILSFFTSQQIFAQPTAVGTINTITEMINSLAGYWVIPTDVAKERVNYYTDRIYLYGIELGSALKESEDWSRAELWRVISKKLSTRKDQWFLTKGKYDSYIATYTGAITAEAPISLWKQYKQFLLLDEEIVSFAIPLMQDATYADLKWRILKLFSENKITKEKRDTWITKIETQIYQYKSETDFVVSLFEDEAKNYTVVLAQTWTTEGNDQLTNTYYDTLKRSSLARIEKLPLRTVKAQLLRANKQLTRYKDGTKQQQKQQAIIKLLEEVIAKR